MRGCLGDDGSDDDRTENGDEPRGDGSNSGDEHDCPPTGLLEVYATDSAPDGEDVPNAEADGLTESRRLESVLSTASRHASNETAPATRFAQRSGADLVSEDVLDEKIDGEAYGTHENRTHRVLYDVAEC